ncbi:MAG TPA: XamI family restriction endonuclease [Planctomycetaceae bacterium]|nr:XamI family restriction endonuclease [Planctomycetaceae bacterium]
MNPPPQWTREDLDLWRQQSIGLFRESRRAEPLEFYAIAFDQYREAVENLIEQTVDLSQLRQQADSLLKNRQTLEIVRCLAGPLISADDLNTLLGVKSISAKRIKSDPDFAAKVVDLVVDTLDQRRFPWVRDGREPDEAERIAAIVASAALLANRKVATHRRNDVKEQQEIAVVEKLISIGWKQVVRKKFTSVEHAPEPGQFCRETIVGDNKADILVRLKDLRLMPIECKVSNSSVNSIKRLNDAKKKAKEWTDDFGKSWIVPAVVLSGVFDLKHLETTQQRGLTLFWGHDLDRLTSWIEGAKVDAPKVTGTKRKR